MIWFFDVCYFSVKTNFEQEFQYKENCPGESIAIHFKVNTHQTACYSACSKSKKTNIIFPPLTNK